MSSFLQTISRLTAERIQARSDRVSEQELLKQATAARTPLDFLSHLKAAPQPRVIAEVKRSSPTHRNIALAMDTVTIAQAYVRAGAAAISVLTEPNYFNGQIDDLFHIRQVLPNAALLLKDFVIEPYQILEARVYGADAVLLIHSLLGPVRLRDFYQRTLDLGLTPLIEVHSQAEFDDALTLPAHLVSVNSRDLASLAIDSEIAHKLAVGKKPGLTLISASGIETSRQLAGLEGVGYDAALVGTSLLRDQQPEKALRSLRTGSR